MQGPRFSSQAEQMSIVSMRIIGILLWLILASTNLVIWREGTPSVEKLSPSDWPIGNAVLGSCARAFEERQLSVSLGGSNSLLRFLLQAPVLASLNDG